jgi:peptidoglycan/LPS O-acetylase OafA/YrhL
MKPAKDLPEKIEIIQTLRGIAAMGVLFAHLWHQQEAIIIHPFLNEVSRAGSYGVQIFFCISGFILLYSLYKHEYRLKDYFRFILRRLIRLEPAYILSILLVLFFSYVIAPALDVPFSSNHGNTFDLILHLLYLVPFYKSAQWVQGVNWTLAIEFQFYLLVGLLAVLLIRSTLHKYWKHLILISISCFSLIYLERTFFLVWLTFFGLGMTTFLMTVQQFTWKDYFIQLIPASVINYLVFSSPYFLFFLAFTPVLIFMLLEKKNMPFQFLGKISYSIYLVHGVIGIFTVQFFQRYFDLSNIWSQIAVLFLATFLSVVIAWFMYILAEKPFTNLSKKIQVGPRSGNEVG